MNIEIKCQTCGDNLSASFQTSGFGATTGATLRIVAAPCERCQAQAIESAVAEIVGDERADLLLAEAAA